MDELTALTQIRADMPQPSAETLAAARSRLVEHDVRPAVLARPLRRSTRPVRRRVLVGITAAAAVAAGALALTTDDTHGRRGTPPQSGPSAASTTATPRSVTVAQLLDTASANALRADNTVVAGQYRYTRTHSYGVTSLDDPPNNGAYEFSEYTNEQWVPGSTNGTSYYRTVNNIRTHFLSASQRRYAAGVPGGIPKRAVAWYVQKGNGEAQQVYPHVGSLPAPAACRGPGCSTPPPTVWEQPTANGIAALPRDTDTLRGSLYRYARKQHADAVKYGKGKQLSTDDAAYAGATSLLTSDVVPSDLRAALYQVAKTVPGIRLIESLANYDGRAGVAIGRVDAFHVEHDLIFSRAGAAYIGDRTVARSPSAEYRVPAGTLLGASAIRTGVASKPHLPH